MPKQFQAPGCFLARKNDGLLYMVMLHLQSTLRCGIVAFMGCRGGVVW